MVELTSEELSALRSTLGAAPAAPAPPAAPVPAGSAPPDGRSIRLYDFRVPDKFPKDVLRQIGHLHDGMSRALTTSLSALMRVTVRVDAPPPEQLTYQAFVAGCSTPAIIAAFGAEPLSGTALLEIDPAIAFPMIDRLLGGSGEMTARLERPVTEIELTVIQRVLTTVLTCWRDAWWNVAPLRPQVLGVETNPLFIQLAAPGDIMLGVTLRCGLGRNEGRLRFCLPHTMLEPVLRRLAARDWSQHLGEAPGARHTEMSRHIARVDVPVRVELARLRLPLRQVRQLRVGDVLPLGVSATVGVRVFVGDRPRFRGRVGAQDGHLAVHVTQSEEA